MDGAHGVLVNISSAPGSLKMREYHEIIGVIQRHIHPDADFKAGMAEIEDMDEEEVRVTVIATGLSDAHSTTAGTAADEPVIAADAAVNVQFENAAPADPFANFNKSVFSTPAFFRKNRS